MAEDITSYFVRQRRSLILISLVFTIVALFGITGTEVRVGPGGGSGMMIDLLDRRIIYLVLFLLWAWFLLRYWQYFSPIREQELDKLRTAQHKAVVDRARPILESKATETIGKQIAQRWPDGNTKIKGFGLSGSINRSHWAYIQGNYSADAHEAPLRRPNKIEKFSTKEKIEGLPLYWLLFRSTFWPTVKHTYFSEYTMPLILAAIPILIVAFNWREVFLPSPSSPASIVGPF